MEQLIEPVESSRQIIGKLVTDYIQRYQLKQQFQAGQFNSDTNRLIAELQLYTRTCQQLAVIAPLQTPSLDQKMTESIFRIIQFLAKYAQKHQNRSFKLNYNTSQSEMLCEGCSMHLNAKKIQVLRRQIFENVPLLGKQDLQQPTVTSKEYEQDTFLLGNEETIKKMSALQRNLNEKQLGLMRIIDQFQDFRQNLLIGLPRNFQKGFEDRFDTKDYVFKLALYFSNNLKTIEEKISHLKTLCKRTEDIEIQCHIKECTEEEKERAVQMENMKVSAMRAEVEIRKLNDMRARLEENVKLYSVQIKHLNKKLTEVQEQNRTIKQEMFVQKLKLKAKSKAKVKQSQSQQQNSQKSKDQGRKTLSSLADLDIANEVLNQLNQRKSQMESYGVRIEQAFPFFKSTFKKALDHFIAHRSTNNFQRKKLFRIDSEQEELDFSHDNTNSKSKIQLKTEGSSNKKQFLNRFEPNPTKMHQKNFFKIYKNQVNYKIVGVKKKSTRHLSSNDEKFISAEHAQNAQKEGSRFLYKRSTLQTEGGTLKKRALHVKLSSLSSEVKDQISFEGVSQKEVQSNFVTPQYQPIQTDTIKDQQTESLPKVVQRQLSDIFQVDKSKTSKSKKIQRHMKNGSLTSVIQPQDLSDKHNFHNLIQIKQIHHKTMTPQVLNNFFQPLSEKIIKNQQQAGREDSYLNISSNTNREQFLDEEMKKQEDKHARMKEIFKNLNTIRKSGASNTDESEFEERSDPKRKSKKKETLNLEELSYLTAFFTLMAQAHLSNESLYSQLKICTFQHSKENIVPGEKEKTMVRQTIRNIILKHRKCSKSQSICRHLTQFLIDFNSCLED